MHYSDSYVPLPWKLRMGRACLPILVAIALAMALVIALPADATSAEPPPTLRVDLLHTGDAKADDYALERERELLQSVFLALLAEDDV